MSLFARLIIVCKQKVYYNHTFMFLYAITILKSASVFLRIRAHNRFCVSSITTIMRPDAKILYMYGQRYYAITWNILTPLERSEMPLKVQRSLKFESVQLTCIIVRHGAREKRGHQLMKGRYSKTWEWWVLFQTNRSKQGRLVRHLPPLKGTTCLLLFHLPASPGTLSEDLNVTIYILFLYPLYHTLSLCC